MTMTQPTRLFELSAESALTELLVSEKNCSFCGKLPAPLAGDLRRGARQGFYYRHRTSAVTVICFDCLYKLAPVKLLEFFSRYEDYSIYQNWLENR